MGWLLHQTECQRARPKPLIGLQGEDAKEKLAALEAELDTLPAEDVALDEDEVDLHLNPKIGADWIPKGVRNLAMKALPPMVATNWVRHCGYAVKSL